MTHPYLEDLKPCVFDHCIDYQDHIQDIDTVKDMTWMQFYDYVYDHTDINYADQARNYLNQHLAANHDSCLDDLDPDLADSLIQAVIDNGDLQLNERLLARQTRLHVNLFPYQEDSANTEGQALHNFFQGLTAALDNLDSSTDTLTDWLDEDIPDCINHLFHSQGYTLNDLANKTESTFLDSINRELDGWSNYDQSSFLVYLIELTLEDLLDINSGNIAYLTLQPTHRLNQEPVLGIFNPVHGSGSDLDVTLERAITFDLSDCFWQIEGTQDNYGHTVQETYHLVPSAWSSVVKLELKIVI